MKANYGYKNGSGEYFITIDTDLCDGCGKCVEACPNNVLEMITMFIDLEDRVVPAVREEERKKIKYTCAPCKPIGSTKPPPCIEACPHPGAITHSW